MPKTITLELYQYDELSTSAQTKAREWLTETSQNDSWWDCAYEDFTTILNYLGFDTNKNSIYFKGFGHQGDGACFEGTWHASNVKPGKLKIHAPLDKTLHQIATTIEHIATLHPNAHATLKHSGYYYHSNAINFFSEDIEDCHDQLKQTTRNLMDWMYHTLEKHYDDYYSEQRIGENIIANNYTFLKDGTFFKHQP